MNKWIFITIITFFCTFLVEGQTKSLDYYLQQGKANNPLQTNYQNRVKSIGLDSLELKANYGFKVMGNGNLNYAPILNGWGYDNVITNGQNLSALIVVSKSLIGKKNLTTRLKRFSINKKITASQSLINRNTLLQNITQHYIVCYGTQLKLALAKKVLSFLKEEDTILHKLAQSSMFNQTDYLAFKVTLQHQQLIKEQLKTQALNELGNLNYLCGIIDSTFQNLQKPSIQISVPPAFNNSVYAKNFQLDSLKISNDAKIIQNNYKPTVRAFADGGYQSSLTYRSYRNFGVRVGLKISLPIYDGKQKNASLTQNKLLEDSRQTRRNFAHQQYQQKILQLHQQIRQYAQLITQGKEQIKYAKTLIDAEKLQMQNGDVRMTDYLLSIHNYLNLRGTIIQNNISKMLLIAQLNTIILH